MFLFYVFYDKLNKDISFNYIFYNSLIIERFSMKKIFKITKKIIKGSSSEYTNADHLLTKKEKHHLVLVSSVIMIPILIGLGVYLLG
jgi:hypothetical protein